jgi:hypothetical protein
VNTDWRSSRFCTRSLSCSWVCTPCSKGHKAASAVWSTVQAGTVAVGGGEACEGEACKGPFLRGLEMNEMGMQTDHKPCCSRERNEWIQRNMGTVYIDIFFWLQKTQFCTRRHSKPHNWVVAMLRKKTKLQLLGPECELRKTHQWSRVKSTKFLHLEGRTNYNCQQQGREGWWITWCHDSGCPKLLSKVIFISWGFLQKPTRNPPFLRERGFHNSFIHWYI